ncbi:tetratricopeptide repeat protein [Leptolyngbya sp. 'hensonii']|uniref:CHAT domain-containing protein n=1 Tax=Leptolyngbya sp. 'hensonii' TaxID=1922337 RepID=UPI000ADE83F6|nr:tetratricopeptide repeat protein [Leptolyngbya sp. 'hensonii']
MLKFLHRLGSSGMALGFMGTLLLSIGWATPEPGKAQDLTEKCLISAEAMQSTEGDAVTLLMVEELRRAAASELRLCQQALANAQKTGNRQQEAALLRAIGTMYNITGEKVRAVEFLRQAYTLNKMLGNDLNVDLVRMLASNYVLLGQYETALQLYREQLAFMTRGKGEFSNEEKGWVLADLAQTYALLGQPAEALKYYRQGLALNPDSRYIKIQLGGALFDAGDRAEAQRLLESAIPKPVPIPAGEALQFDWSRILEFEWAGLRNLYSLLQEILVAQGQPDRALEAAERGKAVAFTEAAVVRLGLQSLNPALIYQPTVQQLQQVAATHNATIVQYSIILNHKRFGLGIENKALYIWVIPPQGKITFRQVSLPLPSGQPRNSLEVLVASSLRSLGVTRSGLVFREEVNQAAANPIDPVANQNLRDLYQLLIQPIADLLPQNPEEQVIFVPHQELFQVPFAALQDETGRYLIERHTLTIAPAIRVLALTQRQRTTLAQNPGRSGDLPLIVGNPTMPLVSVAPNQPQRQLAALPGAEKEAKSIAALLGTQPLLGNQATKAAVMQRMQTARLIHLATHGFLYAYRGNGLYQPPDGDYSPFLFPGILALAPSGRDAGLLTVGEIVKLRLRAELVVLSACETGQGIVFSDGVLGLARSFLIAGVPSVMVSLWQVPDAPTSFLMTQFYQNLQRQPDKARALRQAMLATLKEYPNPKSWAAFVLIGEPE